MIVYKYTNTINKKSYIGITIRDLEERHKEHISHINDDVAFHRAMKKYGVENFTLDIIDKAKSLEELKVKEKYWIEHFNTYAHAEESQGYNLTLGGDGVEGRPLSEESRNKIRLAALKQKRFKGENNPNYGSKARRGKEHNLYGRKHSKEAIYKQSKVKMGSKNPMYGKFGEDNPSSKPVLQINYETGEVINRFFSLSDAAQKTGVKIYSISKCCSGKQKFTRKNTDIKYTWEFEST